MTYDLWCLKGGTFAACKPDAARKRIVLVNAGMVGLRIVLGERAGERPTAPQLDGEGDRGTLKPDADLELTGDDATRAVNGWVAVGATTDRAMIRVTLE